jgi:hypothetical protein
MLEEKRNVATVVGTVSGLSQVTSLLSIGGADGIQDRRLKKTEEKPAKYQCLLPLTDFPHVL